MDLHLTLLAGCVKSTDQRPAGAGVGTVGAAGGAAKALDIETFPLAVFKCIRRPGAAGAGAGGSQPSVAQSQLV